MSIPVRAPLAGRIVPLTEVPDPVFAGMLVGPGLAIDPTRDDNHQEVTVTAPVDGRIAKLHPHAFVVAADDARCVLVHLGLDTVTLAGKGFSLHATPDQEVHAGDPIVTWSPASIEVGGLNPIVPIIALQAEASALSPTAGGRVVENGEVVMTWS